jgi:hexosaminidase
MDEYSGLLPRPLKAVAKPGKCRLSAGMTTNDGLVRRFLAEVSADTSQTGWFMVEPAGLPPGAYTLEVAEDGITIRAGGAEGVAGALATVRQLLPDAAWRRAPGTWEVPCGSVEDAPAYAWRGAMLDVARHFFPKTTILRYVDLLAAHRYNRLHLHLSDDQGWRVESRLHPELHRVGSWRPSTRLGPDGTPDGTPHGGYYTLDDLAEIAAHARSRGITLVPEIDVPGHTAALRAAYPRLGRPGEEQAVLDTVWAGGSSISPTRPVAAFLRDVLGEILDATGTPYFHLGGDECDMSWWAADPAISAEMAEHGYTEPRQMHGHFLRSLGTYLAGRGVRMVVWDEAFATGGLLPDSIVMAWRGHEVAARAARTHDVVRAPLFPTYFNFDQSDLPEERRSEGGPITVADVAAFEPGRALGGQFQVWSEWVPAERHLDYLAFPRACALAEALWSGGTVDLPEFTARLDRHLGRLDAMGVEYRPPGGPHPWQAGGTGVWRRAGAGRIEETKAWVESISHEP